MYNTSYDLLIVSNLPRVSGNNIKKAGHSTSGEQRYRCCNDCDVNYFMLKYRYKAYEYGIKKRAIDMTLNGSGIRDTSRVLHINKSTIISALKKKNTT